MKTDFWKLLTVAALAAAALSLSGCRKDNPNEEEEQRKADTTGYDHVIMYYTVGGGNLDDSQVADIVRAYKVISDEKIKNVAICGFYKPSAQFASEYPGVLRFSSAVNNAGGIGYDFKVDEDEPFAALKKVTTLELMDNSDAFVTGWEYLAKCIGLMKQEFPNGKKYTLVISDHGGAFDYTDEMASCERNGIDTKAIMYSDENSKGESLPAMGAATLVKAVRSAGVKFETLVTDACLMATQENIAEYSSQFGYAMLAAEVTYGDVMKSIVSALSEAGPDAAKLRSAYKSVIDTYVSENADESTSFGFYDLSKTAEIQTIVADFVEIAVEESKSLEGSVALGNAAGTTVCNAVADSTGVIDDWKEIREKILKGNKLSESDLDRIVEIEAGSTCQFQLYDFISNYCDQYAQLNPTGTSKLTTLQGIRDNYMKTLKEMAYINCTKTTADFNDPYVHTSITTNLYSLGKDAFKPWSTENFNGNALVNNLIDKGRLYSDYDDEDLEACRQSLIAFIGTTALEKATSWGKLLQVLEINPGIFTNPARAFCENKN